MNAAIETVNRFFKAWEPVNGYRAAIQEYFSPDCVYENVGLSNTTGPAEAIAFLDGFGQALSFASLVVEMRNQVTQGDLVLNERIDHLYTATGQRIVALRVMGTLEVRGGRIVAWRDYFDSAAFAPK